MDRCLNQRLYSVEGPEEGQVNHLWELAKRALYTQWKENVFILLMMWSLSTLVIIFYTQI